jgi:hypothetical protein
VARRTFSMRRIAARRHAPVEFAACLAMTVRR